MGKVPVDLRNNIRTNIKECRERLFPGWGGAKRCAGKFGVSQQQWSQWERGTHMPDEFRMAEIADFFGVTIEYLRRDNSPKVETQLNWPSVSATRIDNGVEVPLVVILERAVYSNTFQRMERIL